MEPGPPDSKRQRLASWSASSPHPVSLPRPHSTTSPLPPPRAPNHHHHPGSYQPYPPRPTEPHSSAPPTPIHPAGPAPPHPDSDRRHHDQESYAPMQDHYQHHSHPSASPAHGPYQPYPPREVKRETGVEDPHRPSSTGHVSEHPPPHHTLPPPQSYPDNQPRHMSYDNGVSVPPTPGSYRQPAYPPPPPTPLSAQTPYEQHGGYPSEPFYSVSYSSSSMPSSKQKKNTRASQACDQCRQLKAKCDENKPCKTCKDKGLECKYRESAPKAPDKTTAEILEGIMNLTSRFDGFDGLQNEFQRLSRTLNDRMTRLETVFTQNGGNSLVRPDPAAQGIKTQPGSPLLTNGGAMGQYFAQDASHDLTVSSDQAPLMRMMEDDPEAEPGPPVPPGEPAIPMNHTTLAGLLLEWPSIRELTKHLVEREGIRYVSEYPIAQEQKRGPLIVYGRGEDSHNSRYSREPTDHGNLDMADDSSDIASPSPAADFGQVGGLSPSDMVEYKGGVLAADGNPDFTEIKVWSYVESFKNNILNMHPIMQPETLAQWVRQFLDELPTTQPRSTKPQVAKPAFAIPTNAQTPVESTGAKRKRSPGPDDSDGPQTPAPAKAGKPKRSIHSALVLTILALGKICQHRSHIPDVVHPSADPAYLNSPHIRNGAPPSPGHSSPPSYSSHSHSTQPSPKEHHERTNHSRRGSTHGTTGHRPGFSLKKNYEVIPGLEYFAYATDILGNLAGSYNNMKEVYASIFAGLYYGQLNRPLESFQYIHRASHKLQVVMRPSLDKLRHLKMRREFIQDPKYNQLALAFWTCLQLESDLIAELPLPPSGVLNYEEDMPHPNMSLLRGFDQRVLDSYPGQLYLRTHLNSIHRMFYAPDDPNTTRAGQEKFKNVDLVADAVSGMNWVAPSFAFKEDDPPAADILAARLRAKYWGAQMITYRPFIRQILQFTHSVHQHPSSPNPPTWSEFRQDIIAPAIRPGTKSIRDIEPHVIELARKGIKALIESTRAFHNLGEDRPVITNIFGTAHAQWGNLLVLSAAYKDPVLHRYVDADLLQELFQKTIRFFRQSATATSSLRTDLHVLEGLQRDLFLPDPRTGSSFSSQSMHTPRIATTSVPAEANRSTSDSTMGTPQIPKSTGPM